MEAWLQKSLRPPLETSIHGGIPAFSPGRDPARNSAPVKLLWGLEVPVEGASDPTHAVSPGHRLPISRVRAPLPRATRDEARESRPTRHRRLCRRLDPLRRHLVHLLRPFLGRPAIGPLRRPHLNCCRRWSPTRSDPTRSRSAASHPAPRRC